MADETATAGPPSIPPTFSDQFQHITEAISWLRRDVERSRADNWLPDDITDRADLVQELVLAMEHVRRLAGEYKKLRERIRRRGRSLTGVAR